MFPRHNGVAIISESFALNLTIPVPLTNKKYFFHYNATLNNFFFLDSLKWIEYLFSAVNVVSYFPCVGSSSRIKIIFFLLSECTEELMSTPKIITNSPLGKEKGPRLSNPIAYTEYLSYQYQHFQLI